ncbi:carbamoyltransferase HypF [Thioclava sp. IC9]|uniref:carbamoyltransferase HypF n=1 Tax=Thioclava sp. IC9 TaxID=1973007 RepID=UPI000B53E3A3|nr:carbamoyltransferase HypF [Thioclava sp. IC9]OWY06873.1 carbamoyltransferase HypF [Thioclava sp. IC9]
MQGFEIRVRGQVQGVGFRPFIWRLAQERGLSGHVLNDPEGVLIRVAGALDGLAEAISAEAPPLARVDAVEVSEFVFDTAPESFDIVASQGAGAETRVTPDAATCPDCLAEIRGDGRRRHYAFTNCTHCGPRFTILHALPYDRAQTTMAPFEMCSACRAEYENPADRRFHAQPIACPDCGPRVWLEMGGEERPAEEVGAVLQGGGIVAVKGLGGFHLACDATNAEAVALLRERKRRPAKPFALMGEIETIRRYARVSEAEEELLRDPAAPIVLLQKAGEALPEAVAPGQDSLGWMLPYTPLHHLLLREWARGEEGRPLVMTSGNLSGEPQVIGNGEAREKLAGFVDAFLMHDRDIARRLDDSVVRADPPMVLRRARGQVPGTVPLPEGFEGAPQVVGYGGQMKAAICLIKNGQALLGHHLGELDEALTWEAFEQADADYAALFDHRPEVVAVDLHPDFRASRHGAERAARDGLQLVEVQHHHAHLAACMAENGWPLEGGKVAGIVLDGLGLGPDGTVWGGELLLGDYLGFARRGWLEPAPLIGGDRAQAEPWRNALVRLDAAGLEGLADMLFPEAPRDLARQAAAKGINAPLSSSAGRLFDAVAACLGICPMRQSFEGEAAMRLEALAAHALANGESAEAGAYAFSDAGDALETGPFFQALAADLEAGVAPEAIALRFHAALAQGFARRVRSLIESGDAKAAALTGGVYQNALLHRLTCAALGDLPVLSHRTLPANDGSLALGQAVIAAAQSERD